MNYKELAKNIYEKETDIALECGQDEIAYLHHEERVLNLLEKTFKKIDKDAYDRGYNDAYEEADEKWGELAPKLMGCDDED